MPPKPKKNTKIRPKHRRITKIPLKPKNSPKYPQNLKIDQNTPKPKNDQNTHES